MADPGQVQEVDRAATFLGLLRLRQSSRPDDFYEPHRGQVAFHSSLHRIRAMFPGNRFGKSRAMGTEAFWTMHGGSPFRHIPTPKRPVQVWWVCPEFQQFHKLRPQLEAECFGRGWTWNETDHFYKWENGAQLLVISADKDWTKIQGPNPNLICVDEECPLPLWRELKIRGYGFNDTQYIIAATATKGETWMEAEIYRPWLQLHHDLGMDEDQAIAAQRHPTIWCLPKGGIEDNPSIARDKVEQFRGETWASKKEWRVRNFGGFSSWVGDQVFDPEALEWLSRRQKELAAALAAPVTGMWETADAEPVPPLPWGPDGILVP